MSKLLKLKEWLTVEETAMRLSISAGEEVTAADILRLALDGHLTLSVYFVNHARGRPGRIEAIGPQHFAIDDMELPTSPKEAIAWMATQLQNMKGEMLPNGKEVLILEGDVQKPPRIEGVWDLMMLGAERLDVEHEYQCLTGGPSVELICLGGPMVTSPDRTKVFQLLDNFEHRPPAAKPAPSSTEVEVPKDVQKAMTWLNALVDSFGPPSSVKNRLGSNVPIYYPAAGLPDGSVLVVRTAALRELEEKLLADEAKPEKPIHPRERQSMGQVIAALAAMAKLDLSVPYAADETLRAAAARNGIELPSSPETIVKFLKDAAARTGKT